ncbi:hypothetical protein ACKVMT_04425 [Halobacteriales archaeon Cl-PHB]
MPVGEVTGVALGAVALGAVHGLEPGHGWPIAASYALDRTNKWLYGFAASLILGIGHLISSIAMVLAFFYAKAFLELTEVNEPIALTDTILVGGPVSIVAGVLLIVLGIYEYTHGHSHDHSLGDGGEDARDGPSASQQAMLENAAAHQAGHDHSHADDYAQHHSPHEDHSHGHSSASGDGRSGLLDRVKQFVPFVGGHSHGHSEPAADRGLLGIAWFAFLLGFAHEEEFEIIVLCAGSNYCLELMGLYALTVITAIVGLTLLLIAGYERYEERVSQYTPYLPAFSAAVLMLMGVGFILGLL